MAVSPEELLALAERTSGDEASDRAAISRAYYAAYHRVSAFELKLPMGGVASTKGTGMHDQLYQRLMSPSIPSSDPLNKLSRRLGILGQQLHGQRITADYEITGNITAQDRAQAIAQARQIVQLAASICT